MESHSIVKEKNYWFYNIEDITLIRQKVMKGGFAHLWRTGHLHRIVMQVHRI